VIKSELSDFQVTEIPAYEPDGEGDHLYVRLQKAGLSHGQLVHRIRDLLGVSERDIGWAGIKDRHAITRQFVSLPVSVESNLDRLESEDLRVLGVTKHRNKLKRGHLRGNQFQILIRDAHPEALERIHAVIEQLRPIGIPNYFGKQRFSKGGVNVSRGLQSLERLAAGGRLRRGFSTILELQSVQSWLFNRYLERRMKSGDFDRAITGDVLKKTDTGGMFDSEDPEEETRRVQSGQLVPTGPIFGGKMWASCQSAGALEDEILKEAQLERSVFQVAKKQLRGSRRPIAVMPENIEVVDKGGGIVELSFALRKGSYATVFLAEIMKDLSEGTSAEAMSGLVG